MLNIRSDMGSKDASSSGILQPFQHRTETSTGPSQLCQKTYEQLLFYKHLLWKLQSSSKLCMSRTKKQSFTWYFWINALHMLYCTQRQTLKIQKVRKSVFYLTVNYQQLLSPWQPTHFLSNFWRSQSQNWFDNLSFTKLQDV